MSSSPPVTASSKTTTTQRQPPARAAVAPQRVPAAANHSTGAGGDSAKLQALEAQVNAVGQHRAQTIMFFF